MTAPATFPLPARPVRQARQLFIVANVFAIAVFAARKLSAKVGWARAVGTAVLGFFVLYGGLLAALPSLGWLPHGSCPRGPRSRLRSGK